MGQLEVHEQQVNLFEIGSDARQQFGRAAGECRAVPGTFERGHEPLTHEGRVVRDQHGLARRGR